MARRTSIPIPLLILCLLIFPCLILCVSPPVHSPASTDLSSSTLSLSSASTGLLLSTTSNAAPATADHSPKTATAAVVFDYSTRKQAKEANDLLKQIEADSHLQQSIKTITVDGYGSIANWTLFSGVLYRLTQLDDLYWNNHDPVPAVILSALADMHPSCRLHYDMALNNWDHFDREVSPIQIPGEETHGAERTATRHMIKGNKNLYSIKMHVEYASSPNLQTMMLLHSILATCPNLRKLDLSIDHGGCVVSGGQPYSFDFSSRNVLANATLAPLEELKLSGYRFSDPLGSSEWEWALRHWPYDIELRWPWNNLPGWVISIHPYFFVRWCGVKDTTLQSQTEPRNIDGWMKSMDLSQLRSLDLSSLWCGHWRKLRPALTNLDSLTLHYGGSCCADSVVEFLNNATKSQTSLHLSNVRFGLIDPLLDVIESKHNSLTKFTLYEHEEARTYTCWGQSNSKHPNCQGNSGRHEWWEPHLYFNNIHIRRLNSIAQNLTNLDIDVDIRNMTAAEWKDVVDDLSAFQHLQKLTLRATSPTFHEVRWGNLSKDDLYSVRKYDPIVNQTWVEDLFRTLRINQARHLQQVASPSAQPPYTNTTVHSPPSPVLKALEIVVGPWSSRHQNGMVSPDRYVLGHWDCAVVSNATADSASSLQPRDATQTNVVEKKEVCTGRLHWPDYYEWEDGGIYLRQHDEELLESGDSGGNFYEDE